MRAPIHFALLLAGIAGCFTTQSGMHAARDDASKGRSKEYAGACTLHWAPAKARIAELKLTVLQEDQAGGEILARHAYSGDRIAVWFDSTREGKACRIRVYARGQNALGAGGEGWEGDFFDGYKFPYVP